MRDAPFPRVGSTVLKDSTTCLCAQAGITERVPGGIDTEKEGAAHDSTTEEGGRRNGRSGANSQPTEKIRLSPMAQGTISKRPAGVNAVSISPSFPERSFSASEFTVTEWPESPVWGTELPEPVLTWFGFGAMRRKREKCADEAMCTLLARELDEVLWRKRLARYLEAIR